MEVLMLTMFVSLVLSALGVWMFVWTIKSRTHEHIDRLALLPLEDDAPFVEAAPNPATRVE